jgi:hypothetical protein
MVVEGLTWTSHLEVNLTGAVKSQRYNGYINNRGRKTGGRSVDGYTNTALPRRESN